MKIRRAVLALALAVVAPLIGSAPAAAADTYDVDAVHSEVSFQIRHLVSRVRGVFRDFDATIVMDPGNLSASSVVFRIRATSIDTGMERRDNHLRSADFFDVENHPEILFESTSVERLSESEISVRGDFTMRGVTRVVTLPVTLNGEMTTASGKTVAGFSTATRLDRQEYGIRWNKTLDDGGLVLGDDVDISIHLEARRQ
jgi:polyisoprenoid-binding protein YceI